MPATNELLQEGRYRICQPTNVDGNVFEAYDTVRNTPVLVHEFPVKLNKVTTLSQQESMRLEFVNQAKALSEIDHESLFHVQDYFSEIDRQFLVMEAAEGDDLNSLMDRNKRPFPLSQVLTWADQLLDALNYLHSQKPGILHRNVQPSNLMALPNGKVKLLGVGLAIATDVPTEGEGEGSLRYSPMELIWPGLDPASQKVITNSYDERSERILKEPLDARSDIYSLGATLYFLVTGLEPVDPLERSIDILEGKLDPLREASKVDSRIPPEISDVLMKAMEIRRENRYDSAFIMREVLKTAQQRVEERDEADAREQQEAAEFIRKVNEAKSEPQIETAIDSALESELDDSDFEIRAEEYSSQRLAEEAVVKAAEDAASRAAQEAVTRAAEEAAAKAESEKRRQAELLNQRLIEEEQERLRAAQEAAEATQLRMLEEKRAAAETVEDETEAVTSGNLSNSSLEAPVAAEVVAYRDNPGVDEDELAAVLEELEKAELEAVTTETAEGAAPLHLVDSHAEDDSFNQSSSHDVDVTGSEFASVNQYEERESHADERDLFTQPEKQRSSLSLAAIAGAVGILVVIALGVWFFTPGTPETPLPVAAVEVAQPAEPEPQAALPQTEITDPQTSVDTQVESPTEPRPVTAEQRSEDQNLESKTSAAAKSKKTEPVKDSKPKKAVTVDDLINDN